MGKQQKNSKEISLNILYLLLAILCLIWWLCYQSQLKIPEVKDEELLSRLHSSNITIEKLMASVDHMYGRKTSPFWRIEQNADKAEAVQEKNSHKNQNNQTQIIDETRFSPCVILNHKPDNDYWFSSVLSIISQIQHVPTLSLYYINNLRGSKQIQSYLLSNDIHSSLVYFEAVEEPANNDNFNDMIDIGRKKCEKSSIVIVMDDDMTLAGDEILRIVREKMKKKSGMIGYGGLAVINKQRNKVSVGQSYPYPAQIITQSKFKQYPLVISGPVIISYPFLQKITCKYCKNPNNGKIFSKVIKPALFLQMLEKAQGKIVYVDDIIAVVNAENAEKFVTDINVRQGLQQIYKIW